MPRVSQRHDQFFREVFARPVLAAEFLRQYLPAAVVEGLDLGTLALVSGSSVDRHLRGHVADVVYWVRLRSGPAEWAYVLLEYKSWPDRRVAYQLLRYVVAIWQVGLRTGEGLAPVIPVVVYHGRQRWRVGRDLRDLYVGSEALATYWPTLAYQLVDIGVGGGMELVGAPWLRAVLGVMRHVGSPDLMAWLPMLMVQLRSADNEPGLADMWEAVVTYVLGTSGAESQAEVEAALDVGYAGRGEAMMTTVLDKWIDIGRREGRREGQRESLVAGIEVGLQLRFGAPGLALMPRIAAVGDVARLQAIQAALLTATSVSDIERLIAGAGGDAGGVDPARRA